MEKKRIPFIDYLKALCVLLVIVTHYDWVDKDNIFFAFGINMAVPVFMILSGYNFAMSAQKNAGGNLIQMYRPKRLAQQLYRFVHPFLIIGCIELCFIIYQNKHINLPRLFLLGGYGPGSYYVPVLVQLLIVFPIIYKLVEMSAVVGLAVSGLANLIVEIAVVEFHVSSYSYRLLLGRYLLLIAMGCYLYLHPNLRVRNWQMIIMLIVGSSFIVPVVMYNQPTPLFNFWSTTAEPVAFFIFPIVIMLFCCFYHIEIPGKCGNILTRMGKSSYHIFLVQMVYYHFILGGAVMNMHWLIAIPYNILITVVLGIVFFALDGKLMGMEKRMISRFFLQRLRRKDIMQYHRIP